jgi:hypothetical protein
MAKTLPASIFACDKLQEEVPVKIEGQDDDCAFFGATDRWWNVDVKEKVLCGHSSSSR